MTPWTLLAWVGSIAVSTLLALLVLTIVVQAIRSTIRSARKLRRKPDEQIISSGRSRWGDR